jgi:hypothetical protein
VVVLHLERERGDQRPTDTFLHARQAKLSARDYILPHMLMVVFGAGASYDSAPSLPGGGQEWRPPLANDLFENRPNFAAIAQGYTRLLPIIPYLRELHGASVEQVLETLRDEAQEYPDGHRQLAAVKYYLRDILWECTDRWTKQVLRVTNYRSLLDKIARKRPSDEPLLLVTFNYDALLEDALSDHGFKTNEISDYIQSHHKYKLIKLHGSINWSRVLTFPTLWEGKTMNRFDLIDRAADLKMSAQIVVNNYKADQERQILLFPAIAIPVQQSQ